MRRRLLLLALLACSGCPVPPVPPPAPPPSPSDLGLPACPTTKPRAGDVCAGYFTPTGLACARCPDAGGCLDVPDQVYCSAGPCAADPRCARR